MKIYLIEGCTGEYEQRTTWISEAHVTQDAAKNRVKELNELIKSLGYTDKYDYRLYQKK